MRIFSLFMICFLMISCGSKNENDYALIIKSLEKNYTVNCNSNSSFLFCWKVDKKMFLSDSIQYKIGLKKFYSQDNKFLKFLLKNNLKNINQSIKRDNLCDADISKEAAISNEYAIKVLIDNFLTNKNKDTIVINSYINKVKFEKLEQIIANDKHFKKKYLEYIQQIDTTFGLNI